MSDDRDAASGDVSVTALRDIWSASGQTSAELEQRLGSGRAKTCKNMARIGFGGMRDEPDAGMRGGMRGGSDAGMRGGSGGGRGGGDTNTPVDDDIRRAWRLRLEREGKVHPHAVTVGQELRSEASAR